MHESIINNFNFGYVYDFFFEPGKVKGVGYHPLRSPVARETVVTREASPVAKTNAADRNIYFYEDFSTSSVGKKPVGWQARLALDGSTSIVTTPEDLEGNWALMSGNYFLSPLRMKGEWPQNFTLSYDVVAAQNYTWGAKGLTMELSQEISPGNKKAYLQLRLRPGFDGRDGEATIETKFPAPYPSQTKWLAAPGFSNNKKNNRVAVRIKKTGETLQVFIDSQKIAEYETSIPAAQAFNSLSFLINGTTGENDKMYISHIMVTRD
jgi:hypothetical protein